MCGIAGFLYTQVLKDTPQISVKRMLHHMRVRGPDAEGLWHDEEVVLGHRRLAIIDLENCSNQPMLSIDGRYTIVFNGEIYNFKALRADLEKLDIVFRTYSDTEVLLVLFAHEQERMLPKLRGMFAFAIWDTETRKLFLARDPYGIKPLYYTQTSSGLLFASQVKALLASGQIGAELEPAGLAGFYLWGSVLEPWTLYRGISALPAGHYAWAHEATLEQPVCWHDIRSHWQGKASPMTPQDLQEQVDQAVRDSVKAHLVADVPLAVFLSGGIDSSVVAGLTAEFGVKVEGVTIGFEEFQGQHHDEVPMARTITDHYGLSHHVRMVSRVEFEQDLPRILDAMDQPSVDGINTWFASKAAAEYGYKSVLSGVGGDELFAGYSSFQDIPRMVNLTRRGTAIPGFRTLLDIFCSQLAKQRAQPKFAAITTWMDTLEGAYFLRRSLFLPTELPGLMGEDRTREGLARLAGIPPGMSPPDARNDIAAIGLLESVHYLRNQLLRDSDWASMAHSLELRTPLVDAQLLSTLGPLVSGFTNGAGKTMLAKTLQRPLPNTVARRPKTGFTLPMEQWLAKTDKNIAAVPKEPWARLWAKSIIGKMSA